MAYVRTIFNDIAPEAMGTTYSHEHLVCYPPYWAQKGVDDLILDSIPDTIRDVEDFKLLGGQTIVDATAIDYGRDIEAVAAIAHKTNINIIATAGFNKSFLWSAKLPEKLQNIVGRYATFNDWITEKSIDELATHVVNEVKIGLEGTKYRAGQVKTGTGYNSIKPLEEKTIIAISLAHFETGAPIHLHTEAGTMGLEQMEILKRENINPQNVSFGHMDRNLDHYYFQKLLENGSYLCFDGMGKIKYAPESARIGAIIELCKKGYEDQILISHDLARKSYYYSYGYGIGLKFILSKWMPRFIEEANTAHLDGNALMDKFLKTNPQKCFTFKK